MSSEESTTPSILKKVLTKPKVLQKQKIKTKHMEVKTKRKQTNDLIQDSPKVSKITVPVDVFDNFFNSAQLSTSHENAPEEVKKIKTEFGDAKLEPQMHITPYLIDPTKPKEIALVIKSEKNKLNEVKITAEVESESIKSSKQNIHILNNSILNNNNKNVSLVDENQAKKHQIEAKIVKVDQQNEIAPTSKDCSKKDVQESACNIMISKTPITIKSEVEIQKTASIVEQKIRNEDKNQTEYAHFEVNTKEPSYLGPATSKQNMEFQKELIIDQPTAAQHIAKEQKYLIFYTKNLNPIASNSVSEPRVETAMPEALTVAKSNNSNLTSKSGGLVNLQLKKGVIYLTKGGKVITLGSNKPGINDSGGKNLSQTNHNKFKKVDSIQLSTSSSYSRNSSKIKPSKEKMKLNFKSYSKNNTVNVHKILTNSAVQTDFKVVHDKSVQTENFELQENKKNLLQDLEDFPNMVDIVEYLIGNSQISGHIDEAKKPTLINMSKNISLKPKSRQFDAKKQLFLDLRNCLIEDATGNMLIHRAILDNNLKLMLRQIYVLKLRNITVNLQNSAGMLPIQLAIINNSNNSIIESLLKNGASVTVKDNDGNNLIHLSIIYGAPKVLDLLIKHSRNFNIINETNDEGLTPLMLAIVEKKEDFTEALLKLGSDPNIRDEKSGRSALFHAVENEFEAAIALLQLYKADPTLTNYVGISPIDINRDIGANKNDILNLVQPSKNNLLGISNELDQIIGKKKQTKRKTKEKETNDVNMTFVPTLKKI